jgi:hypothetical protein
LAPAARASRTTAVCRCSARSRSSRAWVAASRKSPAPTAAECVVLDGEAGSNSVGAKRRSCERSCSGCRTIRGRSSPCLPTISRTPTRLLESFDHWSAEHRTRRRVRDRNTRQRASRGSAPDDRLAITSSMKCPRFTGSRLVRRRALEVRTPAVRRLLRRFVPPTCHQSNPNLVVIGPVVSAGERHRKVRRSGYYKNAVADHSGGDSGSVHL